MQIAMTDNQIQPDELPRLVQLSGLGKGMVFHLKSFRTTIGRSESNHIVINDESVSRVHAIIEKNEDGSLIILDNKSRNGMILNGKKVEAGVLSPGDEISLGAVSFQLAPPKNVDLMSPDSADDILPKKKVGKVPTINRRILIYGGLGVFLTIFFLSDKQKERATSNGESPKNTVVNGLKVEVSQPPKSPPSSSADSGMIIDPTKLPVQAELEELASLDSGVIDSEAHFRKGQREYFGKNFQRAISSFELALSLNRNHPAASYYLKAAIHESEEAASKNLEIALKYFETLQYKRAIYHFKQVRALLAHKSNDPILKKCDEYIGLAEQRLKAAELYP